MATHYLGDIIHVTCATRSGRRRSPISNIAYNSGQSLTDLTTGRAHSRPHTDGTKIIATDIVCALPCPYGDTSVQSALRREQMYDELYRLNKKDTERVYWKTVIALPNELDAEQLSVVGKAIALSLSREFERPIDFSIHMKHGNYHMHIAVPERKYKNGWGAKSVSYYVNKDGSLNKSKVYKDADGNDVRMPRTINNEAPVYAQDDTGHIVCTNQIRGLRGALQWKKRDVEGLTPKQVSRMHDMVDSIQNKYLQELGHDTIHRNDPRTRKDLKELGISAVHIGKRDTEAKNASYYNKAEQNRKYEEVSKILNRQYLAQDIAKQRLKAADLDERTGEETLRVIANERKKLEDDMAQQRTEAEEAGKNYLRFAISDIYNITKETLDRFLHYLSTIANAICEYLPKETQQELDKDTQHADESVKPKAKLTATESRRATSAAKVIEINNKKAVSTQRHTEQPAKVTCQAKPKGYTEPQLKVIGLNEAKRSGGEPTIVRNTQPTIENRRATTTVTGQHQNRDDEYTRASAIRDEKLEAYRNAAVNAYTNKLYTERLPAWQKYLKAKEPADKAYKKLQRTIELEHGAEPENPLVALIQEQYEKELKKLKEIYPVTPKEPNKEAIQKEAKKLFNKLRADLLEKRIERLKLPVAEHIRQEYKNAAIYAQKCWKLVHGVTDAPNKPKDPLKPKDNGENMSKEHGRNER